MIKKNAALFGLFIILGFLSSCSNTFDHTRTIHALPLEDTLQSKIISLKPKVELLKPIQLENIDNKYLVVIDQTQEDVFQVFKLPELKYLYSWGRMGRGPDEFSLASFQTINIRNNQLGIYFPGLRLMKFYSITDTTLDLAKKFSLSYQKQRMPLNNLQRLNDSVYVALYGLALNTNIEFVALTPNESKPLFTFGVYPKSKLEGPKRVQAYRKATVAKPDGSKFAAFYFHHNKFKIFHYNGSLIKKINIVDSYIPVKNKPRGFIYRAVLYANNNYIYVLAPYATKQDLLNNPKEFKPTVEIWNWEGEPISRFKLDKLIHQFTVSEKYNKLYGISVYETQEIYEYDLTSMLN